MHQICNIKASICGTVKTVPYSYVVYSAQQNQASVSKCQQKQANQAKNKNKNKRKRKKEDYDYKQHQDKAKDDEDENEDDLFFTIKNKKTLRFGLVDDIKNK